MSDTPAPLATRLPDDDGLPARLVTTVEPGETEYQQSARHRAEWRRITGWVPTRAFKKALKEAA